MFPDASPTENASAAIATSPKRKLRVVLDSNLIAAHPVFIFSFLQSR